MKCKQCGNEVISKGQYCSDSCRTIYNRNKRKAGTTTNATGTPAVTLPDKPPVYGRPAVKCSKYGTRPQPISPDDQPHKGGRGKYTRQDGTVYQFDSSGNVSDVVNGKTISSAPAASYDDYLAADGRKYVARTNPDLLNWGDRMDFNELNQAGLKANRVAIPGDWDYVAVTV